MRKFKWLLSVLLLSLFLMILPGCTSWFGGSSVANDPAYVAADESFHKAEKYIYDRFETQNPNEAQTARDLYDAQSLLINRAKGIPSTQPSTP